LQDGSSRVTLAKAHELDASDRLAFARDRFVLPEGIIYLDGNSLGALPRAAPAKLVETAEEVLEELRGVGNLLAEGLRRRIDGEADVASAPVAVRDPDYVRLLAALDVQPAALDELVARTGLTAAALSSMLLVLELDGAVVAENGRYGRR